ncbi:MAG: heavy metal translocating P-type ATPase metal-binding domain-containing protein [Bacteroidetes bacterium]|nr:heavy metal translocating P-type ATPase metal-binding domain-containing protein [Bacteroidota bacterium]MCH8523307.1 heavy metal translocating P-type ATPase metal-binding domain-containing protein [Balneolales bacterium]
MPETVTIEKTICSHCGEHCDDEIIRQDELVFCCTGCQTVYGLLHESGLGSYYDMNAETPGISMRKVADDARFEYLDDPSVLHQVVDFTDGKQARVTLKTPQIHCASCIWLLENLHRLNSAVKFAEVYFDKREVAIRFDIATLPLSKLAALLSSIGYTPDFSLDKIDQKKEVSPNRSTYLKIGVAGFAFGNIMLFSLPEYLSGPQGVDAQFRTLFGALNIILALPVFVYSSQDFFRPAWLSVQQRQWSMDIAISLGIIAMFFRSLYEISTGLSPGYMDSFTMLVFLLLVGRLFQKKTYDSLSFERDYRSYFPLSVIRLRDDGTEESIAATKIAEDDKLVIRNGELLPADAILLDEQAAMDFSFVTGENDPITLKKGDLVYAGGRNTGTSIRFKVSKPVSGSYLTRLWNNEAFRKPREETLKSLSQKFSRYFSPGVLLIAFLSALYWLPSSPATAINAFTAVLIVACPCALALSAPFTLGWATNLLGRAKLYLKNGEAVEHLAGIDTIVFDKTGTLTEREKGEVRFVGRNLTENELQSITLLLHENTHPLGRQVFRQLTGSKATKLPQGSIQQYEEVSGKGVQGKVNGVLIKMGSSSWVDADPSVHAASLKTSASSRIYLRFDNEIAGYFEIKTRYRAGLELLLQSLSKHSQLLLLSGDNDKERSRLEPYFGVENLRFEQSPEDKLNMVQQLRDQGRSVLMVGDGLNDAGALRSSTIGVSIAEDTSAFTPASDVIMAAESFSKLDRVLDFARRSKRIIYISFAISVLYNVIGLGFAVTGTLSPLICAIIMPVSSVTVIAWTTLATHWAAWKTEVSL